MPQPVATPSAPNTSWQTYQNQQLGYSVQYPSGWVVNEQIDANGANVVTFAPSDGGAGISVTVQAGRSAHETRDIPNMRCREVTINGLSGTRCFDTISFGVTTTIFGKDKTYTIGTSTKHIDQNIYQHLLDSFNLIP